MTDQTVVPEDVLQVFEDMLGADGYAVVVHEWPPGGTGRAKLEVIAGEDACADCLVPKALLAKVLVNELPAGIVLDEEDLIYPSDAK